MRVLNFISRNQNQFSLYFSIDYLNALKAVHMIIVSQVFISFSVEMLEIIKKIIFMNKDLAFCKVNVFSQKKKFIFIACTNKIMCVCKHTSNK